MVKNKPNTTEPTGFDLSRPLSETEHRVFELLHRMLVDKRAEARKQTADDDRVVVPLRTTNDAISAAVFDAVASAFDEARRGSLSKANVAKSAAQAAAKAFRAVVQSEQEGDARLTMELMEYDSDYEADERIVELMCCAADPIDVWRNTFVRDRIQDLRRDKRLPLTDKAAQPRRSYASKMLTRMTRVLATGGAGKPPRQGLGRPQRDLVDLLGPQVFVRLLVEYGRLRKAHGADAAYKALTAALVDGEGLDWRLVDSSYAATASTQHPGHGADHKPSAFPRLAFTAEDVRRLVDAWNEIKRDLQKNSAMDGDAVPRSVRNYLMF